MNYILLFFLFSIFFFSFNSSHAFGNIKENIEVKKDHKADTAFLLSIVPGLGQVYNRQLYKIPILLAAAYGILRIYQFNHNFFRQFKGELDYRNTNGEPLDPRYINSSNALIEDVVDFYERNRIWSLVYFGGLYILQMVDAYVAARFKKFDISDKLSFKFSYAPIFKPMAIFPLKVSVFYQL